MKFLLVPVIISLCACKTKKTVSDDALFNPDQIEIDLVDTMNPKRLEGSFSTLDLSLQCVTNKSDNICIYSFNTKKKSLIDMLDLLDGEVGVQGVRKTVGCDGKL